MKGLRARCFNLIFCVLVVKTVEPLPDHRSIADRSNHCNTCVCKRVCSKNFKNDFSSSLKGCCPTAYKISLCLTTICIARKMNLYKRHHQISGELLKSAIIQRNCLSITFLLSFNDISKTVHVSLNFT